MLERILPDAFIAKIERLGRDKTRAKFLLGKETIFGIETIESYRDFLRAQERLDEQEKTWLAWLEKFKKEDFYRWIAGRIGVSMRQVQNYVRVSKTFPELHEELSFSLHLHACKFAEPEAIIRIALDQVGISGKSCSLDWLRKATETEAQIAETRMVQETERQLLSGTAFNFLAQFQRYLRRLGESLAEIGMEPEKQERAEELLEELFGLLNMK